MPRRYHRPVFRYILEYILPTKWELRSVYEPVWGTIQNSCQKMAFQNQSNLLVVESVVTQGHMEVAHFWLWAPGDTKFEEVTSILVLTNVKRKFWSRLLQVIVVTFHFLENMITKYMIEIFVIFRNSIRVIMCYFLILAATKLKQKWLYVKTSLRTSFVKGLFLTNTNICRVEVYSIHHPNSCTLFLVEDGWYLPKWASALMTSASGRPTQIAKHEIKSTVGTRRRSLAVVRSSLISRGRKQANPPSLLTYKTMNDREARRKRI